MACAAWAALAGSHRHKFKCKSPASEKTALQKSFVYHIAFRQTPPMCVWGGRRVATAMFGMADQRWAAGGLQLCWAATQACLPARRLGRAAGSVCIRVAALSCCGASQADVTAVGAGAPVHLVQLVLVLQLEHLQVCSRHAWVPVHQQVLDLHSMKQHNVQMAGAIMSNCMAPPLLVAAIACHPKLLATPRPAATVLACTPACTCTCHGMGTSSTEMQS